MMTDEQLRGIERDIAGVTPGPWLRIEDISLTGVSTTNDRIQLIQAPGGIKLCYAWQQASGPLTPDQVRRNLDFVANSRQRVELLLAEVKSLNEEIVLLKQRMAK